MRLRGLKLVDLDETSKIQFVEAEFLCASQQALLCFGKFLHYLHGKSQKVAFTRVHLCGDKHLKPCEDIVINLEGCIAISELFRSGLLPNLIDFRFTDFLVDPFAVIALSESLTMHPTAMFIDFSRNNLNEDVASAIIQRLYYNPALQKLNFDGNPISTGLFREQVLKPYFS